MRFPDVVMSGRHAVAALLVSAITAACDATNAASQLAQSDPVRSGCKAVPVVALLLDKSRSAPASLVSQLAPQDLDPLIELLRACGGELAVGAIRGRAATPMVRLFIETPPNPPVREEMPKVGNPMILREQRARIERVYSQRFSAYEGQSHHWATVTDAAVDRFRQDVRTVLEEPTTAPVTNVWAALRQADLFLSEPRDMRVTMRHVLVALTDGLHTAGGDPYRLQSTPELFVVNAAGEAGVLAAMKAQRFESFSAVSRAITGARTTRVTGQD